MTLRLILGKKVKKRILKGGRIFTIKKGGCMCQEVKYKHGSGLAGELANQIVNHVTKKPTRNKSINFLKELAK